MSRPVKAKKHPFGELLNQYRLRKPGLTQTHLAELCGYDQAILVRMTQGKKDLTGPSGRERVTRLIATLVDQGTISNLDEANSLLLAASMPPLFDGQPMEAKLITGLTTQPAILGHFVRRTNLTAPISPFIGRVQEVAEIRQLLVTTRLLTLVGVGGSGKTRLARQAAADMLISFANGVWFVELTALTNANLVSEQVASVFGFVVSGREAMDHLVDFLRDRHALIVLDNCEHVITTVTPFATRLLEACPRLSILATSREALNIEGETTWLVPPMHIDEAIALFIRRAQAARPNIILSLDHPKARYICERLDGIPLAIELAAARLRGMSLEDIAARIENRFELLADGRRTVLPRHQTLRALVDWSYNLLSPIEQVLFCRLSIFSGGWTAEMALHATSDDPIDPASANVQRSPIDETTFLGLLLKLVDKSLINAIYETEETETRYAYLETIREYAFERLSSSTEAGRMPIRHAQAVESFVWKGSRGLLTPQDGLWLRRFKREYSNVYSALDWCLTQGNAPLLGCSILAAMYFFHGTGTAVIDTTHVHQWLGLAFSHISEAMPALTRGFLYTFRVTIGIRSLSEATSDYRNALLCFQETGDSILIAASKAWLARFLLKHDMNSVEGQQLLSEALAEGESTKDLWATNIALAVYGHAQFERGDFSQAERFYADVQRRSEDADYKGHALAAGHFLGTAQMQQLKFEAAHTTFATCSRHAIALEDWVPNLLAHAQGAYALCCLGRVKEASTLIQDALAQARERLPPQYTLHAMLICARVLTNAGDTHLARTYLHKSMDVLRNNYGTRASLYGEALDVAACLACQLGRAAHGAQLFGAADKAYNLIKEDVAAMDIDQFDAFNGQRAVYYQFSNEPYIVQAKLVLGEASYQESYLLGKSMSLESIIALAFGV